MTAPSLRFRLQELREKAGLSREELAERCGTTRITIWRLETEESRRIDFDLLDRLARELRISLPHFGKFFERR